MRQDRAGAGAGLQVLSIGDGSAAVTVAAGADITLLAPTRPGDVLVARADLRRRRGRPGVYDVTVTREGGDVIAEFRGRSRTLPSPPPPSTADKDVTP